MVGFLVRAQHPRTLNSQLGGGFLVFVTHPRTAPYPLAKTAFWYEFGEFVPHGRRMGLFQRASQGIYKGLAFRI